MQTDDAMVLIDMQSTLMFVLYSFFFSLIEDSDDGLNGFRIWRSKYPDERKTIDAVERLVAPFRGDLRRFRNKVGFHGSRTVESHSKGMELFKNHSGGAMFDTMKIFKALNAALLTKDLARQNGSEERLSSARKRIDEVAAECWKLQDDLASGRQTVLLPSHTFPP